MAESEMETMIYFAAFVRKTSRLRFQEFCMQYTNRHIPSTGTNALPIFLFEHGANIA